MLFGVYGVKSVNTLTQITLASNTGTFIVYGMTCIVALIAFASRHDRHLVKHIAIPAVGAAMNIIEMLAVFYIAFSEGTGTTPGNATKALMVVGGWVVLGLIWVRLNPQRRHARQVADGRLEKERVGA